MNGNRLDPSPTMFIPLQPLSIASPRNEDVAENNDEQGEVERRAEVPFQERLEDGPQPSLDDAGLPFGTGAIYEDDEKLHHPSFGVFQVKL